MLPKCVELESFHDAQVAFAVAPAGIAKDQPGGDTVDTDTRAVALGAVIEDTLATNPTLGNVPGLLYGGIASAELDYLADDDSMSSLLSYEIAFRSRLT